MMEKFRADIPRFGVFITFTEREVRVTDLTTNFLLCTHDIKPNYDKIAQDSDTEFRVLHETKEQHINVQFLGPVDKQETGAGYILGLERDSPVHGYYYGLYEIGEFVIEQGHQIRIVQRLPIKYISLGKMDHANHVVYLSQRETDPESQEHSYFFVKARWPQKPKGKILASTDHLHVIWKRPIATHISGVHLQGGRALVGFHNGAIEWWDLEIGASISSWPPGGALYDTNLFKLAYSEATSQYITGGKKGEVLDVMGLSEQGDYLWQKTLEGDFLEVLFCRGDSVYGMTDRGLYYEINLSTGQVTKTIKMAPSPKTMVHFRDWAVTFGYKGLYAHELAEPGSKFEVYIQDPLNRVCIPYRYGLVTGDDDGNLTFWRVGFISSQACLDFF